MASTYKGRILLISYGGAHVNAIIPLYKELVHRGYECIYLALTTAKKVAEHYELRPISLSGFVKYAPLHYRKYGEVLASKHHTPGKGISMEESIVYLGTSFAELASIVGEKEAWLRYYKYGLNAFCARQFASKVIQDLNPDLVLATTSPRMEKAFLQAAYHLNIISICMVELFGILEEPWLSRPDNGTFLTVSREDTKKRLVAAGRQSSDIYLTGSPQFDYLASTEILSRSSKWRKNNGFRADDIIIFFVDQSEPNNPNLTTEIYLKLLTICRDKKYKLVVRPHPSNSQLNLSLLRNECYVSNAPDELLELIFSCTIGITISSTVGWEMLLANKPVISLAVSEYSKYVTYGDEDGALLLEHIDDLESTIEQLLDPTSVQSYQLKHYREKLPPAGGASIKVADLIDAKLSTTQL